MSSGRSPDARPREALRLMAAGAAVIAVLAGLTGAFREDPELVAVAVSFAALTLYLYARWRDLAGTGSRALLAAGVLGCAAAAAGVALAGYPFFAVCLAVPAVLGALRLRGGRGA